jgi:hypothetical protein
MNKLYQQVTYLLVITHYQQIPLHKLMLLHQTASESTPVLSPEGCRTGSASAIRGNENES